MKRKKKEILKNLKTYGFKWDRDPIEVAKEVEDGEGDVVMTKRDLRQIFRYIHLKQYNDETVIRNLTRQLYG